MRQLVYVPTKTSEQLQHLQEGLTEDIMILGEPIGYNSLEFVIYAKIYALYQRLFFQKKSIDIPFFQLPMEEMGFNLEKFLNGTYYQCDDLNSDIMLEIMNEYAYYCLGMMNSLSEFGWTNSLHLVVDKNNYDTVSADVSNNFYREYFEIIEENIKNNIYEAYEIYIYVNRELGMFEKYCLSHEVDEELKRSIQHYLGYLQNAIGADNCINSIQEYGHELVFIINKEFTDLVLLFDLLLPVYAYNLKVLLEKAFSMYPIKEDENEI